MKRRGPVSAGIFVAVIAMVAAVYWWAQISGPADSERDELSKPAPDFTLPDINGKQLKLSTLKGKMVLLDYWATWCGPCLEELPALVALQQKYSSKGFTVVGLSVDDASTREVAAFAREHKLSYPIALTGGQDKIPEGYNIFGLPTAYLIDASGVVRRKYIGPKDEEEVAKDIQELLKHV
jgi:peroxiredoxin